jgi:hypothetical protein
MTLGSKVCNTNLLLTKQRYDPPRMIMRYFIKDERWVAYFAA